MAKPDPIHPRAQLFGLPGRLLAVDKKGEIQLEIALPTVSNLRDYAALLPKGCDWELNGGYWLPPKKWNGAQKGADFHKSGANPDYKPTSATQLEREMRLAVSRMNAATAEVRNMARQKAVAKLDVIPEPKAEPKAEPKTEPVVE